MSDKIKVGDAVMLKGSSPLMTVGEINGTEAECFWFGDDVQYVSYHTFLLAMLEVIDMGLMPDDDPDDGEEVPKLVSVV